MHTKWSYKVLKSGHSRLHELEPTLNELGQDGWELTTGLPTSSSLGSIPSGLLGDGLVLILKRKESTADSG